MRQNAVVLMTVILLALSVHVFAANPVFAEAIGDVDGDGKIGLTEAVYALQVAAGLISKPDPAQVKAVEDVLNYTTDALADSQNIMAGTEMIATLVDSTCLGGVLAAGTIDDAYTALSGCNFSDCGTFTYDKKVAPPRIELSYTFLGSEACGGISGGLIIVATYDSENHQIVLAATFDNLTGPECTLDGGATITGDVTGNLLMLHVEANSLSMCGSTLNGTLDATYNLATLVIQSATINGTSRYYDAEADIWINVALTNVNYTPSSGISGTVTVTFESDQSETYSITLSGIVLDPVCGIPTAGTMVIDETITFDFSETTCDDPTVIVMIGNFPVKMSLEDALSYIDNL